MSHLVCPLCGKNAPLSTLNPDNLDLDLKIVSFKGLGRGKGFAKNTEESVLNDDVYTPMIAKRVEKLNELFKNIGVTKHQNIITENTSSKNTYNLNNKIIENIKLNSLKDEIIEMKKEIEIKKQIEYILRECLEFTDGKISSYRDRWCIEISTQTPELYAYLILIMINIPTKLKEQLLLHIKTDKYPSAYEFLTKLPRKQSIAEQLYDIGPERTFTVKDEHGNEQVRKYGPLYTPEFEVKSITIDELKRIIADVKTKLNDPVKCMQEMLDVRYPLLLKVPIIRNKSNS
ncbi:MAG: hypothetical protein NTV61_05505 [Candidatus Bathyarchaeota archaeon]|nr:hypothetical protein [Candidatus Bathyarchaeota archaeon]